MTTAIKLKKATFKHIESLLESFEEIKLQIEDMKRMEQEFNLLHPTERAYALSMGVNPKHALRTPDEIEFLADWLNNKVVIPSVYQMPCRFHILNAEFCNAANVHMSKCPNEGQCPFYNPGLPIESHEEKRFSQWFLNAFPEVTNEIAKYISFGELPNPKLLKLVLLAREGYKAGDPLKYFRELKKKFEQKPKRQPMSPKLRFKILQRDNFTCKYCGRSANDGVVLHVDHIQPVSKGGTDEESNLITACQECNLGKSDTEIGGE